MFHFSEILSALPSGLWLCPWSPAAIRGCISLLLQQKSKVSLPWVEPALTLELSLSFPPLPLLKALGIFQELAQTLPHLG